MTIPDYQALMLPVLTYARDREVRMPDIADAVARDFDLREAEQEELLPSGRQRLFYDRLAWGKFHMIKAGLLESPSRGRFVASSAGRELPAGNPTVINVELLRTFPIVVKRVDEDFFADE